MPLVGIPKASPVTASLEPRCTVDGFGQDLTRSALRAVTGYVVSTLDRNGVIIEINDDAQAILRRPLSSLLGNPHDLLYPLDERAAGQPIADREMASRDGKLERDAWRVRGDGTEFLAQLTIDPLLDEDGRVLGFGCIERDITHEVSVRTSFEAREQHLRSILATVPDAMIVIDEKGRITSFSAAAERLFGFLEHELLGANISYLMPEPDRSRHDQYIAHYLTTGQRRIIGIGRIVVGQRRDGTTFPMELSVGEAGEQGSRVFTGFIRDLSAKERDELEIKTLQAELVHVSRISAMGTMASTLAHELNQPLTAIANYLETVRDVLDGQSSLPPDKLRDAVSEAAEEALRAGNIVRRLRDFVGRGEVEKTIEGLRELIEEAAKLALLGARERGVRSFFTLDPAASPVLVDCIQIRQVLVNLMRNAVEAMVDVSRRELRVSTRLTPGGFVEVSIADSGTGIAPEIWPRLFDAFVSGKADGMGLGLSICRTIIEAHGGRIWAEQPPDGGTIFLFTLIHARTEDTDD